MIPSLKQLLVAGVLFIVVDLAWLLTAGQHALSIAQRIQGSPVVINLTAAVIVYVALAYLIYQVSSVQDAALLGAATYAVYDFTTLTIMKKYEWGMAIADSLWGGALFAIVFMILKRIGV